MLYVPPHCPHCGIAISSGQDSGLNRSIKQGMSHHKTRKQVNAIVQGSDVRVLTEKAWKPDHTWTLQPGDMLYVPPHCPHCGIAASSGQTLSVGFLAPSHEELISSFAADAIVRAAGKRFYEDQPSVRFSPFFVRLIGCLPGCCSQGTCCMCLHTAPTVAS
jgi:ribosomal protein L16 Arg81 hydroxylase